MTNLEKEEMAGVEEEKVGQVQVQIVLDVTQLHYIQYRHLEPTSTFTPTIVGSTETLNHRLHIGY